MGPIIRADGPIVSKKPSGPAKVCPSALALHVERLWEPAWGDPEYQEMVERVGLSL